jgi:hypothetical protein
VAELGCPLDEVIFSFEDTVEIDGSLADAYDFVYRADEWPDRLPHVRRVALREDLPGIQEMDMETETPDGATHTTSSVRVCLAGELIVYKQLAMPSPLLGHYGRWTFAPGHDGGRVTARHTVALDPRAGAGALGPDATPADARDLVRESIAAGSRTTLARAKDYAEGTP